MALHALGTQSVLVSGDYAGFKIAIPVGLVLASGFAAAAAFVDMRPELAGAAIRRRRVLHTSILTLMAVWVLWTFLRLPPLQRPSSEAAGSSAVAVMAVLGIALYGVAAVRFWVTFRGRMTLLPASVIACFVLLTEAMIGVAITGERSWHASWWEWHGLIVLAYLVVGFAATREWRDERFRPLYLETTRERRREVSVLFGDLVGFTTFSERSTPTEVGAMLNAFYAVATPLVSRQFAGVVERLTGDGMLVSFNAHGDQPDHAVRAAATALALQRGVDGLAGNHEGWPRLRVAVNTGDVVIREMGGDGYVAYELCGDAVNIGARLEQEAPVGGVLIGAPTYRRLPFDALVEARPGLRLKGKDAVVDAYVLLSLP
jgi:class 3 adenylate cyclase